MLFNLGALTIDSPGGLNAQGVREGFGADYAVKPVVGAQQPREPVGISDRTVTITGTIYPFFQARAGVSTGLDEIGLLKQMAYSQQPQLLVNALGQNLGWFLILHVDREDSNLSAQGVGRTINYTIAMAESPSGPPASSIVQTVISLFSALAP